MRKRFCTLATVLAIASLLSACGAPASTPSADESSSQAPSTTSQAPVTAGVEPEGIVAGTTLNLSWDSDKQTHLPYTSDSHATLYLMLYDTLFETHNGETTGLIAKDWSFTEDNMQCDITIHDDIYFCLRDGSQGNHVTAQTVVDSLALTEKHMSNYFTNIDRIEVTGDYTLSVYFSNPYPDFTVQFSEIFTGIVDPSLIAEYGEKSNEAAIGTGPYYLVEYQAAERFVFKANPNYWDADRMPHIETVTALIIPEASMNQVAIKTGEIDWFETADPAIVEALTRSDDSLTSLTVQGSFNPLYFNCNNEPFDDPNVRKAIGLLIDSQALVDVAYSGKGTVINAAWPDKCVSYQEVPDANVYDPDEGLRLLEEAGVDPNSLVIDTYCSYLNASYMPALQAQLAKYGITLNFETYEVGTFVQSLGEGDWDVMAWFGMLYNPAPYQTYVNMYGENGFYRCLFIDETYPELWEQVQTLLDEAGQCTTIDDQVVILQEIDQLLAENYIWRSNVQGQEFKVYDAGLQNMQVDDHYNFTLVHELYWAE